MSASTGLRIAIITTFYPPYHFGGDGQAIRRLVHALARRGHRVDVIHDVGSFLALSDGAERPPIEEPPGVRVHALRSRLGVLASLATQQVGKPLVHGRTIRRILSEGFDVIHFHNVSLVGGPGILRFGEGVKLYTAHEHWLVCPTHVLWRHKRELCTGRECVRCVLRYRRPLQAWRYTGFLDRQLHHVDEFLTLSEFSANKHAEFGFQRPMSVFPTFLPEAEGHTTPPPTTGHSGAPYYLFVGRLELIKGLQDVIPLFAGAGTTELLIAGTGDYERELRRLAAGSSRVRFLGQQTIPQLRDLYRNAIAALLPSVCYEVFPMVVLESFRESTPIIARNLGPFPEIVARSKGGLLFSTGDELASALSLLAEDTALRNSLGVAGANAFNTYWHESVAMKAYFGIIRNVALRRGLTETAERALAAGA